MLLILELGSRKGKGLLGASRSTFLECQRLVAEAESPKQEESELTKIAFFEIVALGSKSDDVTAQSRLGVCV